MVFAVSPTSAYSSHSSVSGGAVRPQVYRHEPYAAGLISPGDSAAAFVSYHQRSPKSMSSGMTTFTSTPTITAATTATPHFNMSTKPAMSSLRCTVEIPHLALPAAIPPQTLVYVSFKYGKKLFIADMSLYIGSKVVVEGDRGIDLGIVGEVCMTPCNTKPLRVLRRATADDEVKHAERLTRERDALSLMRSTAKQVECPAYIEDTMFQLDGKKITVVISRSSRSFVDFRRLQRALFDTFRCRIWFAYLDEIQETMSTDVIHPLRRNQRRRSPVSEQGQKKRRSSVATDDAAGTSVTSFSS